ncbi:unnamed protein product [Sphagnum jensenii]|uniref:Uncharacterized protein n=1 Tax=Sphagnum jensenii TaxID=128206 RepID=A0ABP0XK63_9BRYO
MHGRRVGPNVTGGSYRPEHAAPTTPLPSSLFLLDAGIKPGTRTPTAVLAMRDNMGRGDAWASVGCQIITGVIVPTYPQAFR